MSGINVNHSFAKTSLSSGAGTRDKPKDNVGSNWQPKAWQTGLALATIAAGASFQKSLMPRTRLDQAIITAGSIGMGFAAGALAEKTIQKIDGHTKGDRNVARSFALLGGFGAWAGLAALGAHTNVALSTVRTAGLILGSAAALDILLHAEHDAADDVGKAVGGGEAAGHVVLFGAAALAAGALTIGHLKRSKTVPTPEEFTRFSTKGDEALAERMKELAKQPITELPPLVLPAGSKLDPAKFTTQGERFIRERTTAAKIGELMDGPIAEPKRFYVPLEYTKDEKAAAQLMLDELKNGGGFDRSRLILYTPSGTGFVNPFPVEAEEYMARGDVTSIAFQYGKKPSVLSPHKAPKGGKLNREFLQLLKEEVGKMPADKRPEVMVYGESLGAWASQWAGKKKPGVEVLHEQGIDRALWSGTPHRSKWHKATMNLFTGSDKTGEMRLVRHIEDFEALTKEQQAIVRYFSLRHHNDAVGLFGLELLVQRPWWLPVAGQRPVGVPAYQQWMPGVTFLQTLFDTKNATHVIPGVVAASGHDYRADIAPLVRAAFDHISPSNAAHVVNDSQLESVAERLTMSELERARRVAHALVSPTGKLST